MRRHLLLRRLSGVMLSAALFASAPYAVHQAAAAETYCVSCTGPDQTYACQVETDAGVVAGQPLALHCVYRLAKQGGHSSCALRRVASGPCNGADVRLVYDGPLMRAPQGQDKVEGQASAAMPTASTPLPLDPAARDGAAPAGASATPDFSTTSHDSVAEPVPEEEVKGPPKTLVEMTGRAVKNTNNQVKKTVKVIGDATERTGEAISGAARKATNTVSEAARSTFRCVTSLFSKC